jgi:hypothetical protein
MVDMIMAYDASIQQGNYDYFSQTYGSAFATWAYVYDAVGNSLGLEETEAFIGGLIAFFNTFDEIGPTGIQADMDLPVLIGMYYAHITQIDASYSERTEAYARSFFEKHFNDAGYIDHGGGFDPSYGGISIKYMTWLAHLTEWDFVIDALAKMHKLKSHLTFPEPGGKVYGPSSFATSTTFGSPNDQAWSFGRDVAASFLTDEAAYLRYGYRNVEPWQQPFGIKPADDMLADLETWTNRLNTDPNPQFSMWVTPSDKTPEVWEPSKHLGIPSLEWDFYPEGAYDNATNEFNNATPPFGELHGDFIEQFG